MEISRRNIFASVFLLGLFLALQINDAFGEEKQVDSKPAAPRPPRTTTAAPRPKPPLNTTASPRPKPPLNTTAAPVNKPNPPLNTTASPRPKPPPRTTTAAPVNKPKPPPRTTTAAPVNKPKPPPRNTTAAPRPKPPPRNTTAAPVNKPKPKPTPPKPKPIQIAMAIHFPPVPHKLVDQTYKDGVAVKTLMDAKPFVVSIIKDGTNPKAIGKLRELMAQGKPELDFLLDEDGDKRRARKKVAAVVDPNKSPSPLGFAIHCTSPGLNQQAIGKWRYKKKGDADWKDIPHSKNCSKKSEICVFVVQSTDRLKFEPKDKEWQIQKTKLLVHAIKNPLATESKCLDIATAEADDSISDRRSVISVERLSCSGLLDASKVDKCGKCGGSNECVGCDGQINSTAKMKCGVCYGGNTNKTDPMKASNNCVKYCEDEKYKNECAAECKNKVKKDCTGKCGGDFRKDLCGQCLARNSSEFNKCDKILRVFPNVISSKTAGLSVSGVYSDVVKSITCLLKNTKTSKEIPLATNRITRFRWVSQLFYTVTVEPSKIPAGQYTLKCTWDKKNVESESISAISSNDIKITGTNPTNAALTQKVNVTVMGSGFVNTAQLRCSLKMGKRERSGFKAKFVSSSKVVCTVQASTTTVTQICLRFSNSWRDSPKCADFKFKGAPAPKPTKCSVSSKLKGLSIAFDQPVRKIKEWKTLFTQATLKIISRCRWTKSNTILYLDVPKSSDISKGFKVGINYKKLQNDLAKDDTTYDNGKETIDINCAPNQAKLQKPKIVGVIGAKIQNPCSPFTLSFRYLVLGSKPAKIEVKVDLPPKAPATTSEIDQDIKELNDLLANKTLATRIDIPKERIVKGRTYRMNVTVTDKINQTATTSFELTRKDEECGATSNFAIGVRDHGNTITLQLNFFKTSQRASIKWSCMHNIKIQSRKTKGIIKNPPVGKNITCYVKVTTSGESKTRDITFAKKGKPLTCGIKDGNREVGQNDQVWIRGAAEDPDDDKASFTFSWSCSDESGAPCTQKSDGTEVTLPKTQRFQLNMSSIATKGGETLTFRVKVESKTKSLVESEVKLTVKEGSPPTCKLLISKKSFDSNNKIKLKAGIVSKSSRTKFSIEMVAEEGYGYIEISNAISKTEGEVKGSGRRQNPSFIFKAKVLTPKSLYKMRLTCEDTDTGIKSQAEGNITTSSDLSPGTIKTDITEGRAMIDKFTISVDESWDAGDSGDSEEETTIMYRCGWYDNDGKRVFANTPSKDQSCVLKLPAGPADKSHEVHVFMIGCTDDKPRRCAEANTTVTVKPTSRKEAMDQASKDIEESTNSGDVSGMRVVVKSALAEGNDDMKNETEAAEKRKAVADLCKKVLQAGNDMEELSEDDEEAAQDMIATCAKSVDKKEISDDLKKETLLKQHERAKSKPEESEDSSGSSKRKRRAVSEPAIVVNEKTPEQVKTALQPFDSLIDINNYTIDAMDQKKKFIDLAKDLGRSMCKGIDNGEEARVAELSSMVLRSIKNSFEAVDANHSFTGCEQCTTYKSKTARVLLGKSLKDAYDDWNCDDDIDGCNGACLVSTQMFYDMLLNDTYSGVTRASDVIEVLLFNPKTYLAISVSKQATPVTYTIPVYSGVDMNKADLKCHRWDAGLNNWTTAGVTTGASNTADKSITCTADQLHYLAIFDMNGALIPTAGPAATTVATTKAAEETGGSATTTAASDGKKSTSSSSDGPKGITTKEEQTTSGSPTNKPTSQQNGGQRIQFKLEAKFEDHIPTNEVKEMLEKKFRKDIAKKLGIGEERIKNVTFTKGSIIVSFTLLPGNTAETSVEKLTSQVEKLVTSGNLTFTTSDGKTLYVIKTSFMKQVPTTSKPTFTDNPADSNADPGGLKQEVLIGIIAGACLVVLIVIVVGLYCRFKSRQKVKDDDSRKSRSSVEGISNDYVMEEKPPVGTAGIRASLPGSPIYDNVR